MQDETKSKRTLSVGVLVAAGTVGVFLISLAFWPFSQREPAEKQRINRFRELSDSLVFELAVMNRRLEESDRIFYSYISSLEVSLRALEKESLQNKAKLRMIQSQRDSLLLRFCQQMATFSNEASPICE